MLVGTARGSEGHSGALCGIWGKKDGKRKLFAQQKWPPVRVSVMEVKPLASRKFNKIKCENVSIFLG